MPIDNKVNLKRDSIANNIPAKNTYIIELLFNDFSKLHKDKKRKGIYKISVEVAQNKTNDGIIEYKNVPLMAVLTCLFDNSLIHKNRGKMANPPNNTVKIDRDNGDFPIRQETNQSKDKGPGGANLACSDRYG